MREGIRMYLLQEFWDDLRRVKERTAIWQLLVVFLGIPLLLVVVDAVVDPQRWALDVTAPSIFASQGTVVKAFTSAYVHVDSPHLFDNVGGFIILISGLFPLALLSGRQKQLLGFSFVYLVLGPFWTSYFSLVIPFSMNALGFSGINGAFLGYLPILLFAAFNAEMNVDIHPVWSAGPVLLSVGAIILFLPFVYPPMNPIPHLVYSFGGLGVFLTLWLLIRLYRGTETARFERWNWIVIWGIVAWIIGLYGLFFGIEPSIEKNVFAHFGGYFLGFSLPFAFEVADVFRDQVTRVLPSEGPR